MLRNRCALLSLAGLTGAPALGQAFNVDINPGGATHGAGTPAASYGAFPGQVGFWNNVNNPIGSSYTLKNLAGVNTAATLQTGGTGGDYSANESFASGGFELLMEDGHRVEADDADTLTYTFNNLNAGPYFIYTYGDDPASSSKTTRVTVGVTSINVGGTHGTNAFVDTVTHARHYAVVQAGQPLVVTVGNNTSVSFARGVVMGIQIVPLPTRLYVDASAPAGGDGTSWTDAFNNLQDALAAAGAFAPAVTEIWVADGIYEPDTGINRSAAFHLRNGVAIIGGFAGGETDVNDRDVFNQRAYLSGDINTAASTDNSYHVVRASSTNATAVLDGFWFTSGYANGTHPEDGGSAIFMSDGSATIRDCYFVGGFASGGGGHVLLKGNSAPTFLNCTFINGDTPLDGGSFRIMTTTGWITMLGQSRFLNCQADSDGGALVVESGSLYASNCQFTGNDSGQSGGAVLTLGTAVANLLHCSLAGNTAGQYGGAVTTASGTVANIYNSILWDNTAAFHAGNVQSQLYQAAGSTITLRYSCAQFYNGALFANPGNTGANPQFVNPTGGDVYGNLNDDLRLQPTSALIDAGSNSLLALDFVDADQDGIEIEAAPFDLDFNARRRNHVLTPDTGVGPAPVVDIGAYEFIATCPGDLDGDGDIDLDDLLIVLADYGCTGDCGGDGDGNGATNLDDLLFVLGNFGGLCD